MSSSDSSKISAEYLQNVIDTYKIRHRKDTTLDNYIGVWRKFNKFIIAVDNVPDTWEEKISLYCGFLVEICGLQSATIKSYVSAIKYILRSIDYFCDDQKILLSTFVGICKEHNDHLMNRMAIKRGLMEQILFQIERKFAEDDQQPYLEKLYKTVFIFMYYGMLRIGEVAHAKGGHTLKAKDVHLGINKNKILIILRSSKTHGKRSRPQEIRISATANTHIILSPDKHFCPFQVTQEYKEIRGDYFEDSDQFFVFQDQSPLRDKHVRSILKSAIRGINLDPNNYDTHSFRIGRATDLKKMGCPVETIKDVGRWKSNAVYKYLRS